MHVLGTAIHLILGASVGCPSEPTYTQHKALVFHWRFIKSCVSARKLCPPAWCQCFALHSDEHQIFANTKTWNNVPSRVFVDRLIRFNHMKHRIPIRRRGLFLLPEHLPSHGCMFLIFVLEGCAELAMTPCPDAQPAHSRVHLKTRVSFLLSEISPLQLACDPRRVP